VYEDLYEVGGAASEPTNGWATYTGAVPAKVTIGALASMLAWHIVVFVGKLLAAGSFGRPDAGVWSSLGSLALLAVTGVAFLVWFFRAYQATAAAENTLYPPDQAVWSFFVPLLNLVRPYQIAADMWRKTDPAGASGTSPLLLAWWVLWCLGRACPFFLATSIADAQDMRSPVFTVAGVAEIASAVAAILVVRTLDARIRTLQGAGVQPATF